MWAGAQISAACRSRLRACRGANPRPPAEPPPCLATPLDQALHPSSLACRCCSALAGQCPLGPQPPPPSTSRRHGPATIAARRPRRRRWHCGGRDSTIRFWRASWPRPCRPTPASRARRPLCARPGRCAMSRQHGCGRRSAARRRRSTAQRASTRAAPATASRWVSMRAGSSISSAQTAMRSTPVRPRPGPAPQASATCRYRSLPKRRSTTSRCAVRRRGWRSPATTWPVRRRRCRSRSGASRPAWCPRSMPSRRVPPSSRPAPSSPPCKPASSRPVTRSRS